MDPDAVPDIDRVPHGGSTDPDVVDFSANVNPRTPAGVRGVYEDALAAARRYPDDRYPRYRETAAEYVGCDPESVIPTPGGLAGLRLAIASLVAPGDEVVLPAPSFGEYAREVRLQGARPRFVSPGELPAVDPGDASLVVACTPNNPTGEAYDSTDLTALAERCREAGARLVVDEAFLGFTHRKSIAGEPGTVAVRSLTKLFGLPGLRAGFAVATGELRDRLAAARRAWNLGIPAAAVGSYCMEQDGFVTETRGRVRRERSRLRERLADHVEVFPSEAPFLLLDVGDRDVDRLIEGMRERGIAIRDARTFRGLESHVRVAVRTSEDNDLLLEAFERVA